MAKLITNGKFKNCKYSETEKCFKIKSGQTKLIKDSIFWGSFEKEISKDFINFFNILLFPNSNINIDDLFKHKWLEKINNDKNYYDDVQKKTETFFQNRYNKLVLSENDEPNVIDTSSILNSEESNHFKKNLFDFSNIDFNRSHTDDNSCKLEINEIKHELKGILNDYIEIQLIPNDNFDSKNFFFEFMNELEKALNNSDDLEIIWGKDSMEFTIIKEEKNEKQNSDEIIEDDDNLSLNINLELLKYTDSNEENDKYYLVMNLVQGDILEYYNFLKKIKKEAKQILKEYINLS